MCEPGIEGGNAFRIRRMKIAKRRQPLWRSRLEEEMKVPVPANKVTSRPRPS